MVEEMVRRMKNKRSLPSDFDSVGLFTAEIKKARRRYPEPSTKRQGIAAFDGDAPRASVSEALKEYTPKELLRLEALRPHIIKYTGSLWNLHCSREFRGKKPHEAESWRQMYLRLTNEAKLREAKLKHLNERISKKVAEKKALVNKSKLLDFGGNIKRMGGSLKLQSKSAVGKSTKSSIKSTGIGLK